MEKTLTKKQQDFCMNYVTNGFNASEATIAAGYSQNYAEARAHELASHPLINEQICQAREQASQKVAITYEWKIGVLEQIINVFMKSPSDKLTSQDAKVVIHAISELNRMSGDYAPQKHLSANISTTRVKLEAARREYEEY